MNESWVGGHYSQGNVSVAIGPSPLLLQIERLVMLFYDNVVRL